MEINYLKNKFNENILEIIEECKKIGYTPSRFIQMLQLHGNDAYQIVPELVNKKVTAGLEILWKKGRLDLSIEAVILKPEYQILFSPDLIKMCKKKLEAFHYKY